MRNSQWLGDLRLLWVEPQGELVTFDHSLVMQFGQKSVKPDRLETIFRDIFFTRVRDYEAGSVQDPFNRKCFPSALDFDRDRVAITNRKIALGINSAFFQVFRCYMFQQG